MKDDKFSGDLQAWIEPELEARIVALILGEASDFEREELERLMEERPELAVFMRRITSIDGLVRESAKPDENEDWKLSEDKRAAVMKVLGGPDAAPDTPSISELTLEPKKPRWRRAVLVAAACLVFSLGLITIGMVGTSGIRSGNLAILEEAKTDTIQILAASEADYESKARVSDSRAPSAPSSAVSGVKRELLFEDATEAPERSDALALHRSNKTSALEQLKKNMDRPEALVREDVPDGIAFTNDGSGPVDSAGVDPFAAEGPGVNRLSLGSGSYDRSSGSGFRPTRSTVDAVRGIQPDADPASAAPVEADVPAVAGEMESTAEVEWQSVHGIAGDVFASKSATEKGNSLDRLAERKGVTLKSGTSLGDLPQIGGLFKEGKDQPAPVTKPAAPAKVDKESGRAGGNVDHFFADKDEIAEVTEEPRSAFEGGTRLSIPPPTNAPGRSKPGSDFGEDDGFGTGWGRGGFGGGSGNETGANSVGNEVAEMEGGSHLLGKHSDEAGWKADAPTLRMPGEAPADKQTATNERGGEGERASQELADARDLDRPKNGVFGIEKDKKAEGYKGESSGGERDGRLEALAEEMVEKEEMDVELRPFEEAQAKSEEGRRLSIREREAIRRQNSVSEAEKKLMDGRDAYAAGDYEKAVSLYRKSLNDLPKGLATKEREQAILDQLKDGSVALAQEHRRVGRYDEARELLEGVLVADPDNSDANELLSSLSDPIRTSPALTHEHAKDVDEVRRGLYRMEGYYNLGKFDEAQQEAAAILRKDPQNKAAQRWAEKVNSAQSDYYRAAYDESRSRLLMEVDRAWELAVPPEPSNDGLPASGESESLTGAFSVRNRLDDIIIPSVDFEDVTVDEALDFLRQRSRELDTSTTDSNAKGLNFVVRKAQTERNQGAGVDTNLALGSDPGSNKIKELKLENVPLSTVLEYIGDQAKLRYKVDDFAITMLPRGSGEGEDLLTRAWEVPPSFLDEIVEVDAGDGDSDDPFAGAAGSLGGGVARLKARPSLREALENLGISMPEGSSASYLPGSSKIVVRNTPGNLDLMDHFVKEVGARTPTIDYSKWYRPVAERREIEDEDSVIEAILEQTILPVVDLERASLEETLDFISTRVKELSPAAEVANLEFAGNAGKEGERLQNLSTGELKLRNVPAATVLDYALAEHGLDYRVRNGRVEIGDARSIFDEALYTRVYKMDPSLIDGLRVAHVYDEDDPFAEPQDALDRFKRNIEAQQKRPLKELLENCGVSFPEGAQVSYDEESQTFSITNRAGNLDLVDALVRQLARARAAEEPVAEVLGEDNAAETPFSTFSLHVSDVSFKLAQAALQKGQWPESERVRTEEFVNAFDYQDPTPTMAEKVGCQIGQAAHPYAQQRNLMRISMSTAALGRGAGTPLRLTVLLDNSGSMDRSDRAESVRRAFALLAAQLNENDEVTLISFARTPRLLRDRVSGNELGDLSNVVGQLQSEGGTNLEAALGLGIAKAKASYLAEAQNRVILLTDGAANLGNAEPDTLRGMIENLREQGIAFDACGVGADGLNDEILESLTRKGDGRYYFLDRPEDADAGFARQIAGALRPAAQNVKVQVEFNPERVGRYKLYGFEKHELKKEDFRNDSVDAAELAAEEAGVAVYQVEAKPDGKGPVGTVAVRFRDMSTGQMVERTWEIPYESRPAPLDESAAPVRLAGTAALFAERLKGTAVGDSVDLGSLVRTARGLQSLYPNQERIGHLIEMIEQARRLSE